MNDRMIEAFEKNFEKSVRSVCWNWEGRFNGNYGCFSFKGVGKHLAHRFSYLVYNGEISDGLYVLHRCDNPPCVNPYHLFLGTQADNMHDMIKKGRLRVGKRYSGDENVSRRCPEVLVRGEDHHNVVLTEEQVRFILENYVPRHPEFGGVPLARRFGVQQPAIIKIVRGVTWQHVPRPRREHIVFV